jgi:hypothetical protein
MTEPAVRLLAQELLDEALRDEQAARRTDAQTDVAAVRAEVRRLARARGVRIRTGMVDDAIVVILADARLWKESAGVMREKLTPLR